MEDDADLLAIAILIDELRHDEIQRRLNSIRKLELIGKALGPARTRDELLPYLGEFVDDEDEVLLALCDELPQLFGAVGGAEYAPALLKPLEALATVEESTVREKALAALRSVVARLAPAAVDAHAAPLVQRLATGDWFTHRIASCALFAAVYARASDAVQHELRTLFPLLCRDETPMVRRAACAHIGAFAAALQHEHVIAHVVPALSALAVDEQDSVRLLAVEHVVAVARVLSPAECAEHLAPLALALAQDSSWRVRYMTATHVVALCEVLGEHCTRWELAPCFVLLLRDGEAEVRTAAASQISRVAALLGADLTAQMLLPPANELAADASQFTRAALASVVLGMASVLHRADVIAELLPLFLHLLKDSHPEVRLNVIARLDVIHTTIGVDTLAQSLLPAIGDLAADKKWRIRYVVLALRNMCVHVWEGVGGCGLWGTVL